MRKKLFPLIFVVLIQVAPSIAAQPIVDHSDKIDVLIKRIDEDLKSEQYNDAKRIMKEWEELDSQSPALPLYKKAVNDLENEPDKNKKEMIITYLAYSIMKALNESMGNTLSDLETAKSTLDEIKTT